MSLLGQVDGEESRGPEEQQRKRRGPRWKQDTVGGSRRGGGHLDVPFPFLWNGYKAQTAGKALHAPMSLPFPPLGHPGRTPLLGYKDSKSLLSISFSLHLMMGVQASIYTPPISMRRKERGKLGTQNSARLIHPLWASLSFLMRL